MKRESPFVGAQNAKSHAKLLPCKAVSFATASTALITRTVMPSKRSTSPISSSNSCTYAHSQTKSILRRHSRELSPCTCEAYYNVFMAQASNHRHSILKVLKRREKYPCITHYVCCVTCTCTLLYSLVIIL